jgi:hypothetical protein
VKKALKKSSNSARSARTAGASVSGNRFRRLSLTTLVMAIAIVAIAAVTVASRQQARVKQAKNQATASAASSTKTGGNFLTVKVAGQDVQVDPQTGKMKALTPEEAQRMAGGLKRMLNKSSEGLVEVQQADGSVSMDLKGRFQNVTLARVNKDGSVSETCVDNPKAAGQFLGIDPKLMEEQPR